MYEERQYFVYIITNPTNTVLYTGMTNDLARRVWEHREKQIKGFTSRYNVSKLVYYEIFNTVYDAIEREKQIKAGSRQRKIDLINAVNPKWIDLYNDGEILNLPIEGL
jgi:putative endonuclease